MTKVNFMPKFFKLTVLLLLLSTLGLGCKFQSKEQQEAIKPIELTWWRVFDDSDSVSKIIEDYRKIHPNITINYRKLRPEEYETELLNALAEDRGPDIFTIHNTAMAKWQPKLLPLPPELKIAYQVLQGTIKKEVVIEIRNDKTLRPDQVKNIYVDQVGKDVILSYTDPKTGAQSDKVYGLPLGLDTPVLYWNRDLLNAARIPEPAKTWDEFLQHVQLLTKFDAKGNIIQAGAAIGTSKNVERSTDILSTIMLQNGVVMQDDGAILFDQIPPGTNRQTIPGIEALQFYTDFANPTKKAYTWNDTMPNSIDAFVNGTVAYYFGYAYDLPTVRARAPKLNFGLSKFPQIDPINEINFANYWVEGVSEKTEHPNEAWDFVEFATDPSHVTSYLSTAKKPAAVRSIVSSQLEDPDLSVFASQVLTAKSWYHGSDPEVTEASLGEMIDVVVAGTVPIEEAIHIAVGKVEQTLRQ